MDSTEALRCDLEEFEAFLKLAKRPSVKSFLSAHCQRLRNQIEEVNMQKYQSSNGMAAT